MDRIALTLVACLSLSGTAPAEGAAIALGAGPEGDQADAAFTGVRFWYDQGGDRVAAGTASAVLYQRAAGLARGEGVRAVVHPRRPGERPLELSAPVAVESLPTRQIEARGGVVLVRDDEVVTTDSARFDGDRHRLSGTEPVQVTTPRFQVSGQGFTLDTMSEQMELAEAKGSSAKAGHRGTPPAGAPDSGFPAPPPESRPEHPLDIRADHLTVLTKESRGVWKGNVHAIRPGEDGQPDLHLRCDELVTDYEGDDRIDQVTCKGHVEMVQGDRAGWGDLAVFDNQKGILVVTGSPHGRQGANNFRGTQLTFYVSSDRIEVENAKVLGESKGKLPGDRPEVSR